MSQIELDSVQHAFTVPGLIAVVGCDGTGKSTLTHDLVARLSQQRPVARRYLGLISGEQGDKIKKLPIIGRWLERRLAAKSEKAQNLRNKAPAAWASLIIYGFSRWRAGNLKKVCELARSGTLVIADRYPQAEIPGFHFDGPGMGLDRLNKPWLRKLAQREQHIYEQMAESLPTLIIRLDIDLETAMTRKPDHGRQELSDKIAVMSQLHYNGARILDLDARAPYEQVLAEACKAISEALPAHEMAQKVSG